MRGGGVGTAQRMARNSPRTCSFCPPHPQLSYQHCACVRNVKDLSRGSANRRLARYAQHDSARRVHSTPKALGCVPTSSAMVRVDVSSKAALLLSLGALGWAMQYNGQQCLGAVDFELKDGSDVATLDAVVGLYLSGVPGWVKQECMDAVRTNVCGRTYAPHAEAAISGTTYCQSQCVDIAAACQVTAGLDPDLAALAPSQQCMGLNDDADCVLVGELNESLLAEGECPEPLVVAKRNRFKEYEGKIVDVRGTACVVGCPIHRTFYGESYLKLLDRLYLGWAITGLAGAAVILSNIKPTGRRLYAWMFSSGSLCLNLLSVIFLAFDYHEMLCDDGVGHRRRSPFMAGIGFGIHYCMLFSIIWICLQTVAMWKVIHGASPSKIAEWRKHFPYITIFSPLLICAAPLIGQNYGWSVMSMLPFPLMLVEDTKAYFWATFYTPILVLVLAQFMLGADAVYTFCRIIGRNYHCRSGGMTRRKFWNILRYNSEALIFMVAIGLWTTICAGFVGYQTGHASYEFRDGMEEYIQCLLEHAYDGVDCPRGDFYDLSVKYTALEVVYISSFGIIALIAFSPSTRLWRAVFRPGARSNSSATDTEPPPTPRGSNVVEMKTFSAEATSATKKHLSVLSSASSDEEDGATSSGVEFDSKHSSKDDSHSKNESREVDVEADSPQAV